MRQNRYRRHCRLTKHKYDRTASQPRTCGVFFVIMSLSLGNNLPDYGCFMHLRTCQLAGALFVCPAWVHKKTQRKFLPLRIP